MGDDDELAHDLPDSVQCRGGQVGRVPEVGRKGEG